MVMKISPVVVWRKNDWRKEFLGKKGKLISWSVVRSAPVGMEKAGEYVVGIVKVGKKKVVRQIVDVEWSELKEGMSLVGKLRQIVCVDKEESILYGVKFGKVR
jgi:uncharacterized OB-fold protein